LAVPPGIAAPLLLQVQRVLGLTAPETRRLSDRVWKFSAEIRQPRKDDRSCNKTPFFERWNIGQTSHLTPTDPRYATHQECDAVYSTLVALLMEAHSVGPLTPAASSAASLVLGRPVTLGGLSCVHTSAPITGDDIKKTLDYSTPRLGAYEIPISYKVGLDSGGTHARSNVGWMKPLHVVYELRAALRSSLAAAGVAPEAIDTALDKIQVKSNCTDKQTMPPYFSNRDIRWATWPSSPRYACRFDCAKVELELMAELFEFSMAPPLNAALASAVGATRGSSVSTQSRVCFVTGKPLDYSKYLAGAKNPRRGRSTYHVGHLLPLTRGGKHTSVNVAWVSDDGNRIQGNDTIQEIEDKLAESVEYHLRRDVMTNPSSSGFLKKVQKMWTLLNYVRIQMGKPPLPW